MMNNSFEFLTLEEFFFSFTQISIMLAKSLLYIAFIMLLYFS